MTKAQLLTKVRELIAYFHSCGEQVGFADIGELAQRILDASVHIFSREGGLLIRARMPAAAAFRIRASFQA